MKSTLYEYAILRVVPQVEREEFINIGVILYCHQSRKIAFHYEVPKDLLQVMSPSFEVSSILPFLESMQRHCAGQGPLGDLPQVSRFRWLTATKSTLLQFSKVHPGYSPQPMEEVNRLMTLYVKR